MRVGRQWPDGATTFGTAIAAFRHGTLAMTINVFLGRVSVSPVLPVDLHNDANLVATALEMFTR